MVDDGTEVTVPAPPVTVSACTLTPPSHPPAWLGIGPATAMAAAFDTLEGEVAVLDATGTILAVNAGWKRFAAANDGVGIGVGTNYLAACASSSDPFATVVLQELRAIAAGLIERYQAEYTCDGPAGSDWRRLTAVRAPGTDPVLITVRHEPLGEVKRDLATRLERSRRRMLTITDRMGDGLCTLDDRGRITYVNPVGECLLQAADERALGGSFVNRLVGTNPDGTVRTREQVLIGADFDGVVPMTTTEDLLVRTDGSQLPIEYLLTPLPAETLGQPDGWVVVFRDISERKERERRLAERTEHVTWMRRIQEGLDDDRFVLHAQPIVDLATMRTVQHELLIRLEDPEEGLISPGRFLPTAEAYGLAPSIDRWVIGQALEIAAQGQPVELNLSAKSLTDPSLPYLIEGELNRTGADPATVVFEITETALIENDAAVRNFAERLRGFGCKLALDDFGTGYSGFSYLKYLPVDLLKIDMEFVHDAVENPVSQHVIRAVVSLAHAFGLRTVAEGVEDRATLELLRDFQVDEAQGYYLGRPAPLAERFAAVGDGEPTSAA